MEGTLRLGDELGAHFDRKLRFESEMVSQGEKFPSRRASRGAAAIVPKTLD